MLCIASLSLHSPGILGSREAKEARELPEMARVSLLCLTRKAGHWFVATQAPCGRCFFPPIHPPVTSDT